MPKFTYYLLEVALLLTVPVALATQDLSLVALFARVLCVALFGSAFWRGTQGDRFFAFGFLQALMFGAVWTAEVFGVVALPVLWPMFAVFALEIFFRIIAHRIDWRLKMPSEYLPTSSKMMTKQ